MGKHKIVLGAFDTAAQAHRAIDELTRHGVSESQISVLMNDRAKEAFARIEKHTKGPEGFTIGSASGAVVGALAAGLTAVAAISIPGIGVFVAGPIIAALAGAGAGGAIGGAAGGLIGLGISEHEARFHTSILKNDGVIVVVEEVDTNTRKVAERVFREFGTKKQRAAGAPASI